MAVKTTLNLLQDIINLVLLAMVCAFVDIVAIQLLCIVIGISTLFLMVADIILVIEGKSYLW